MSRAFIFGVFILALAGPAIAQSTPEEVAQAEQMARADAVVHYCPQFRHYNAKASAFMQVLISRSKPMSDAYRAEAIELATLFLLTKTDAEHELLCVSFSKAEPKLFPPAIKP